jgi:hypothetical protein
MCHRGLLGTATIIALMSLAGASTAGQSPAARSTTPRTAFRTAWGDPDLQGVWNYAAGTPLERPAEFSGKAVLTDEELARAERQMRDRSNMDRRDGVGTDADVGREANEWWFTRRSAILNRRTSLITDPPDGKLPPVTPEAKQSQAAAAAARRERGPADSYEDRNLTERCIMREPNGPPILPTPNVDVIIGFTFQFRILQNADYVAILSEVVQQARIIPLDGRPHLAQGVRQWLGDSRGRWEGNTLVVETTNFHDKRVIAGFPAGNVRLVERFTRVGADAIDYQFTVNDPTTWTRPWSAAVSIEKTEGEIYEFACHEGNYSMTYMLSGARAEEKQKREGKGER